MTKTNIAPSRGAATTKSTTPDDGRFVSDRRLEAIRVAACETMRWADHMQQFYATDGFGDLAPTMFRRMERLSSAILSAVEDPEEIYSTEALEAVLNEGKAVSHV